MKTIIAAVLVASALISSNADAKQVKAHEPTHCTTVYVLGAVVTTCR